MNRKAADRTELSSDELDAAIITALLGMNRWRPVLQTTLDKAFDQLKNDGHLSTAFSDALDDFGRYCLSKGEEVRAERKRRGIGQPKILLPAKY